uniref:UDENN domain-containing protein n=1 Tax=Ditylenchus dipsaci TaxID=166011 RepID=A0A915D342_9BILA
MSIRNDCQLVSHPILHILVVGFHHKHGYQIEYCFPPVKPGCISPDLSHDFPQLWSNLPSLSLPDGAHNVESDVIYFLLPSLEHQNRSVYGISCYRQIASDQLKKDEQITRSSVQKSVCVISRAYFNEKDFSKVDVLMQMYRNLCDLFDANYLDTQTIYAGVSLTSLLTSFRHRTLVLFKLLLLERKVIFKIFPVQTLGAVMVGLISLFPGMLEEGLSQAASYSVLRTTPASSTHDEVLEIEAIDVTEEVEAEESKSSQPASSNISTFNTNEFGFPLSIFSKGSIFHPYLSIDSLDMVRSDNIRAYCIGVTNALFTQRQEMVDVVVSINDKEEGQIDILSPELKKELALTKQDLRFMDFLLKMIELNSDPAAPDTTIREWEGGEDWIRTQFSDYLLAILSAASFDKKEHIAEFNEDFVNAWKVKHNYRVWSCDTHLGMANIAPVHPFSGQSSMNDVLLQVNHTISGSEQGRKVINTFSNTSKYVSETGSKLKANLFSWVKGNNSGPSTTAVASAAEDDDGGGKGVPSS